MLGNLLKLAGKVIVVLIAIPIIILLVRGCGSNGRVSPNATRQPGFFEAKPTPREIIQPEYTVTDRAITLVKVPWGQSHLSYTVSVPMEMWVNDDPKIIVMPGKEPDLDNAVQTMRFRCVDQERGIVSFYEERK